MNVSRPVKYVEAAPQASTMPQARDGWLARLKHWVIGQRDPIQAQLHEVERQGRGMARLMHAAGYLMLILFSVGSAVGICGTLVQRVMANGPLTWASLPDDIVITVSLMLVFCMDLGDIYAAFMIRLLATRRAKWTQYILHGLVILVATILEGGTFILMSFQYDNVVAGAVAALVIGRGIVAPLFAVYLNMARAIPVGVADIAYHSFLAAGQGVVRDTIVIANDSRASLAEKAELMSASAHVGSHEQETLDRIIAVAKKREDRAVPALPEPRNRVYAASLEAPATRPLEHRMIVNYQAMHGDDMEMPEIPDEVNPDDTADYYATMDMDEEDLQTGISGRKTKNSSPRGSSAKQKPAPTAHSEAVSKGMKQYHQRRRTQVKDTLHAILNDWAADGRRATSADDATLAEMITKQLQLSPAVKSYTIQRLRGGWQKTTNRKARSANRQVFATPLGDPEQELEGALP